MLPIAMAASQGRVLRGGVKIGEATNGNPYQFTWNSPPVRAHLLTAVATDNQNATTISGPIPIMVYDAIGTPVAAITSPADGAVMEGPTNLLITAIANAINGVTNVQFLANGVPFGNDATHLTRRFGLLNFSVTAAGLVSDANGVTGISAPVNVIITIPPTNVIAPTVAYSLPLAFANVTNLTNITVVFSERVQNVNASDLLVNGLPATGVIGSGSNYTFSFRNPPTATWTSPSSRATASRIMDSRATFRSMNSDDAYVWSYELIDTTPPFVLTHVAGPRRNGHESVGNCREFSESVIGVDETDLLVNGVPAFAFSGGGTSYVFNVSQPASGTMSITWATTMASPTTADIPTISSAPRQATSGVSSSIRARRSCIELGVEVHQRFCGSLRSDQRLAPDRFR